MKITFRVEGELVLGKFASETDVKRTIRIFLTESPSIIEDQLEKFGKDITLSELRTELTTEQPADDSL